MRKIQGITLVGMLLTMACVVIAGIVIMRVIPVYLQQYKVVSSVRALNSLPASDFSADLYSNTTILRKKLTNQFNINDIESISPEQVVIDPDGEGKFKVSIKYRVIKPLIGNVSLLFDFEVFEEVNGSAQ